MTTKACRATNRTPRYEANMVSRIEALLAQNQDMYPQAVQDTQRSVAERLQLLLDDYRQTKCALRDMFGQSPSSLDARHYKTTEGNLQHAHPFMSLPRPFAPRQNFVDSSRHYASQHYFNDLSLPRSPAQNYACSPTHSYHHACSIASIDGSPFYATPVVSPVHFPLEAHVPVVADTACMLSPNKGTTARAAAHYNASAPHTRRGGAPDACTAFLMPSNAASGATRKESPARSKRKRKVAPAFGRGTKSLSPLNRKQVLSGDFRAQFTKVGRRTLGIDVTPSGGFLVVRKVQPGGLVAAWNAESQDHSIEVNDIIVELNGHTESYKMLQAVKEDRVITFGVKKYSSPRISDKITIDRQNAEHRFLAEQRAGCENTESTAQEKNAEHFESNSEGTHTGSSISDTKTVALQTEMQRIEPRN